MSFDPKKAWSYLTEDQKEEYARWRQQRDGGRAYYWLLQEVGNEEVGIRGQFYIRRAVQSYLTKARSITRSYLEVAWRS